ncbi:ribulose-phosphate 3-epimerase, putative [Eimeria tenella]|uniref:Ribulose-phosphate 3-epimerase, putative n=1 Tax=Eimeria tenella TaxID=5802 RepID=U6KT42_EIMTE|nr:ribulose-phosphate 3-epimerase, putative [Eimeria tenella]CDJ38593.1 ribulose-phosphate 3-epimerase, putative [Eimeria tenella]|eukprot:XP_013229431.1 ribulose-phosphate 3-epimerase, putative [Eimeria tenella]
MKAGVALKPGTPLAAAAALIEQQQIDNLLLMTVEPGLGGQTFLKDQIHKIKAARQLAPNLNIQVDGGLNAETVKLAAEAGANVIVAGTSLYKAESPRALMNYMREVIIAAQKQQQQQQQEGKRVES